MAFHIVNRHTGQTLFGPYTTRASAQRRFNTANIHASMAAIEDDNWRDREKARKNLVDLSLVGLTPIEDHFLFVSKKISDADGQLMVSYTADEMRGRRDIQNSPTRIGRYLTAWYNLGGDALQDAVRVLTKTYVKMNLRFARGRKAIRALYERCHSEENGCNSCMTHPVSAYSSHNIAADIHPVEAYGGPDLAVAYIERDGKVAARALCWPDKRLYGRVYGDNDRLVAALDAHGFTYGRLNGARLLKLKLSSGVYAAPYIDNSSNVQEDHDYLILGAVDPHKKSCEPHTYGYAAWNTVYCALSGKEISHGLARLARHPGYHDDRWIDDKLFETNTVNFGTYNYLSTGEFATDHYWRELHDGTKVPRRYADDYCVTAIDNKLHFERDCRYTDRGHVPIPTYLSDYAVCQMTAGAYPRDEMIWMEHGAWWSRSAFTDHGVTIDGRNYARMLAPTPATETETELQEAA